MGRECVGCGVFCSAKKFSKSQWRKGDGCSRCKDCVGDDRRAAAAQSPCTVTSFQCFQEFSSNPDDELNMHMPMQVHHSSPRRRQIMQDDHGGPRNIACVVCGEVRFRSAAGAVQHFERGCCPGCPDLEDARNEIYQFASSQQGMREFLADDVRLLTTTNDGDWSPSVSVPKFPYHCRYCSKSFRQLSQLLQHQDKKHNHQVVMLGH